MDKPAKKTLHLKIALAIIFSALLPAALGLFIPLTPPFYILIGIGCSILSITFLFWTLKPLGQLIKNTREFAGGSLNIRADIRSGDEFEDVGTAFNLMVDKISKTLQQLETDRDVTVSEKNKLNEILTTLIDGIIAVDFNKNILLFNKSAQELTGFSETEVLGKPIDQVIHFFADQDEILSKTYCKENFNQTAKLIGKSGKQTRINLMSTQVDDQTQSHLSSVLMLHDLSREEELEQMKLDFVSMASHELKTPLTSIVGYLSVALNENKDKIPAESLQLLQKAFTSAQQLQTLIQNLLNVNKIERDKFTVSNESVDYLPILSKVVEDLRNQANQKNIVLTLKADNLQKVFADPIRIAEVLTNLVANAINYTNPGGKVEITTSVSPTELITTISDTGAGIPKEAISHLFTKFFRVSNLEQKGNKGTGLGLYISKSIVEKLRGKIWAESEEGHGSKFSFTLPLATQTAGFLDRNKFTAQAIQSGSLNY
ncbi:PAS domain S-box protein [Patescibacteria group bacterium]|nr:PAS domain S-box protein [Patescibacteria group bacterium]